MLDESRQFQSGPDIPQGIMGILMLDTVCNRQMIEPQGRPIILVPGPYDTVWAKCPCHSDDP